MLQDMEIPSQKQIEKSILVIRGHKVLLDSDMAQIYGVTTKRLNEQVQRNKERFPVDFMFQLTEEEFAIFKNTDLEIARGGRRYLPFVFTEHGTVMLASVLNSKIAVSASIQVVGVFISFAKILSEHASLAAKLDKLEKKYDYQFKVVFDAIRELVSVKEAPKKRIGINQED
jgi:hypothetical protein